MIEFSYLETFAYLKGYKMAMDAIEDDDPNNWKTINGSRVHLDPNSRKIDGGAGGVFNGKELDDVRTVERSSIDEDDGDDTVLTKSDYEEIARNLETKVQCEVRARDDGVSISANGKRKFDNSGWSYSWCNIMAIERAIDESDTFRNKIISLEDENGFTHYLNQERFAKIPDITEREIDAIETYTGGSALINASIWRDGEPNEDAKAIIEALDRCRSKRDITLTMGASTEYLEAVLKDGKFKNIGAKRDDGGYNQGRIISASSSEEVALEFADEQSILVFSLKKGSRTASIRDMSPFFYGQDEFLIHPDAHGTITREETVTIGGTPIKRIHIDLGVV